jgi:hypothetical protein
MPRNVKTTSAPESCWPDPGQELLLRAALLRGDDALRAWRQWKRGNDVNEIDTGSYRLLPLLYANLRDAACEDELTGLLKGVYRNAWYKNQLLFHHAAAVLSFLRRAGVETIVLKGIALTRLYYRDMGLRYMDDVDLLVRPGRAVEAMKALRAAGWRAGSRSPEALLGYEHAAEFSDGAGRKLDLHWRAMWEGRPSVRDDDFWEASLPLDVGGAETRALCAADQLLHVCVHGANWNPVPPLRWVADALMIMRGDAALDWARLVEQARKRQLTLAAGETLGYLRRLLDAPVPEGALLALKEAPVSRRERLFFRIRTRSDTSLRRLPVLWHWYDCFRAPSENASPAARVAGFAKYLQSLWGVERLRELPLKVSYRVVRAAAGVVNSCTRGRFRRQRPA